MLGKIATTTAITKSLSGGTKPVNRGFRGHLSTVVYSVSLVVMIGILIFILHGVFTGTRELTTEDLDMVVIGPLGIWAFMYLLRVSPYTQTGKSYRIEFKEEGTFEGIRLFYKEKEVLLDYEVDEVGKFKWKYNGKKTACVCYKDGSKMKRLLKYKITNYYTLWLLEQGFLSDEVTVVHD